MTTFKYEEMLIAKPASNVLRRQAHTDHMMMTIVDFVDGPSPPDPPHSHPHEQISYIAEGQVRFIIGEGENQTGDLVRAGDMVVVPPNAPHTVEVLTEAARLIDCFHPIREDFLSKGDRR